MELGNILFGTLHTDEKDYKYEFCSDSLNYEIEDKWDELRALLKLSYEGYPQLDKNDYIINKDLYIDDKNELYGIKDVIMIHPYQWVWDEIYLDGDPYPNMFIYPDIKII